MWPSSYLIPLVSCIMCSSAFNVIICGHIFMYIYLAAVRQTTAKEKKASRLYCCWRRWWCAAFFSFPYQKQRLICLSYTNTRLTKVQEIIKKKMRINCKNKFNFLFEFPFCRFQFDFGCKTFFCIQFDIVII